MTDFDSTSFFETLWRFAARMGRGTVELALTFYYALESDRVPYSAKLTILGALAYLVLPADAVPDIVPVAGFTDDAGVLALAFTRVALHIDDDMRERARRKTREFF